MPKEVRGRGSEQMGKEVTGSPSASDFSEAEATPTPFSELASEKAGPGTLWKNLETALCSIGKNTAPLPPKGHWD
jgi:hypothetical protein